jgi:hypothetical protein
MRDYYVFLHVCSLQTYNVIFEEMWDKACDLIKNSKKTYIGVVGPGRIDKPINEKNVEVVYFNEDPITKKLPTEEQFRIRALNWDRSTHEFPTLNLLRKTCEENICNVGYFHLRGVTSPQDNLPIIDQRKYMTYFNIERYEHCIDKLNNHDACGVDLVDWPFQHFSGNFWWARSEHINLLPPIEDSVTLPGSERHKCEFWVCSIPGNYYSFHNTGIHPTLRHLHRYEPNKYRI